MYMPCRFTYHEFGIRVLDCFKLAISPKNNYGITICRLNVKVKFCRVSLVKFSYWYKFHVSMTTDSGVMKIFVYKGLTRNPEIRNTPF